MNQRNRTLRDYIQGRLRKDQSFYAGLEPVFSYSQEYHPQPASLKSDLYIDLNLSGHGNAWVFAGHKGSPFAVRGRRLRFSDTGGFRESLEDLLTETFILEQQRSNGPVDEEWSLPPEEREWLVSEVLIWLQRRVFRRNKGPKIKGKVRVLVNGKPDGFYALETREWTPWKRSGLSHAEIAEIMLVRPFVQGTYRLRKRLEQLCKLYNFGPAALSAASLCFHIGERFKLEIEPEDPTGYFQPLTLLPELLGKGGLGEEGVVFEGQTYPSGDKSMEELETMLGNHIGRLILVVMKYGLNKMPMPWSLSVTGREGVWSPYKNRDLSMGNATPVWSSAKDFREGYFAEEVPTQPIERMVLLFGAVTCGQSHLIHVEIPVTRMPIAEQIAAFFQSKAYKGLYLNDSEDWAWMKGRFSVSLPDMETVPFEEVPEVHSLTKEALLEWLRGILACELTAFGRIRSAYDRMMDTDEAARHAATFVDVLLQEEPDAEWEFWQVSTRFPIPNIALRTNERETPFFDGFGGDTITAFRANGQGFYLLTTNGTD